MNKPRWEEIHDQWIEDIEFEYIQKKAFTMMIRESIEDSFFREVFMECIKRIDNRIKMLRKEYKKVYGVFPRRY